MAGSGVDIRKVGSGNPGFNNVLRVSKSRAVWALLGDMGKGVGALVLVWLAFPVTLHAAQRGFIGYLAVRPVQARIIEGWLFGFAAILGHCYSPFLKFRGGKGIATSAGVMLVLYPLYAVIALAGFATVRAGGSKLKLREAGAIASLSAWILFVLLMLGFKGPVDVVCAAIVAAFLFWRHQRNLRHVLERKHELPVRV